MLRRLFTKTRNPEKSGYIWNSIAGILFAMQSALLLIVITRTNNIDDAGVFSIGYAIASLMSFIGEFGVRKFQASDVSEHFSYIDYYSFRIITCVIMILACLGYVGFFLITGRYSLNKFLIIMGICMIKLIEAYTDVFYGRFQQKHRLDIGAKTNSFRICLGLIACSLALVFTHDLLKSVFIWLAASLIGMFMSTFAASPGYCTYTIRFNFVKAKSLFVQCLPIFLGSFLLVYIGNAPKYAIDACLSEADQAKFNFIFMPVFVIGLLANFVFNPVLVSLAEEWNRKRIRAFDRMVLRQMMVIGGITALAVAVALTIGCPVLGWFYATDLSDSRMNLTILMIGGGMLALVNFFAIVITVIRYQHKLTIGYISAAVVAMAVSERVVSEYGITGAAVLYTSLMAVLAILFYVILKIGEKKGAKEC